MLKTKDTDYIEGSRFLRTVIKHIKHVLLKSNQTCKLDILNSVIFVMNMVQVIL